ncbi:hypothetical protein [Intestinibacter bartlettii]|uniref:hypothetical protein n=1 Tax=Intestinibacter bartlettii TaxID=261299 RepID=UPI0039917836
MNKQEKEKLDRSESRKKYAINKDKLERKFINKFNMRYGQYFEYIGGYKQGKIKCRCKVCGDIKERVKDHVLEKNRNIACRKCGNNYGYETITVD